MVRRLGLASVFTELDNVHNFLTDFGGDNNRITIFGESAGGVSVSLMTLAKKSWGYYNRAIMEVGKNWISDISDRGLTMPRRIRYRSFYASRQ